MYTFTEYYTTDAVSDDHCKSLGNVSACWGPGIYGRHSENGRKCEELCLAEESGNTKKLHA